MWCYETEVGTFYIVEKNGRFHIIYDDEDLGSYATPWQAEDDLAGGHTYSPSSGVETDLLDIPEDIREWSRHCS